MQDVEYLVSLVAFDYSWRGGWRENFKSEDAPFVKGTKGAHPLLGIECGVDGDAG